MLIRSWPRSHAYTYPFLGSTTQCGWPPSPAVNWPFPDPVRHLAQVIAVLVEDDHPVVTVAVRDVDLAVGRINGDVGRQIQEGVTIAGLRRCTKGAWAGAPGRSGRSQRNLVPIWSNSVPSCGCGQALVDKKAGVWDQGRLSLDQE
jgi:hypothetical protein